MSDYKELLGDIADCLITHPSEKIFKTTLHRAYDAIEQLVKERDEAVAEAKEFRECSSCPHRCFNRGGVQNE